MTNLNYKSMSQVELRQYILAHRDDQDAIHEAVLRLQQNGREVTTDELTQIIEDKRRRGIQP